MLGYRANAYHIRLGFQLSIQCPSKPSKLNQAELEIVVMTPTAMAKAANTVWLAPVRSFAVPSLNTTSSEGGGTAPELGISADTLGVLTAIVWGGAVSKSQLRSFFVCDVTCSP